MDGRHLRRAIAAAHMRSGIPPAELLASILSEPAHLVGHNRQGPPSLPMTTIFERMKATGTAATSAIDLHAMGAFGLESDTTLGPATLEQRRGIVAGRLPAQTCRSAVGLQMCCVDPNCEGASFHSRYWGSHRKCH